MPVLPFSGATSGPRMRVDGGSSEDQCVTKDGCESRSSGPVESGGPEVRKEAPSRPRPGATEGEGCWVYRGCARGSAYTWLAAWLSRGWGSHE